MPWSELSTVRMLLTHTASNSSWLCNQCGSGAVRNVAASAARRTFAALSSGAAGKSRQLAKVYSFTVGSTNYQKRVAHAGCRSLSTAASSSNNPVWLNGRQLGDLILTELSTAVSQLKQQFDLTPCLVCVLVGDRPDSVRYIASKERLAHKLGIRLVIQRFPFTVSESTLMAAIRQHNFDANTHGILVQLPLPASVNKDRVIECIHIDKDVDGLHPTNLGRLCRKMDMPRANELNVQEARQGPEFDILTSPAPCTPKGILMLLDYYKIPCAGRSAVVLGRSPIVGLPVSLMLSHRHATVSICHSQTPIQNIQRLCRAAEIIIAACGVPVFVQKEWIRPGAAVIDVGINAIDGRHPLYTSPMPPQGPSSIYFPVQSNARDGLRIVGDVHPSVSDCAAFLSPVPGGVGPMTLSVLMCNVVQCALAQRPDLKADIAASDLLRACASGEILRRAQQHSLKSTV